MGLFRQQAERKRQSTVGVNRKWRGNSVVGKKLHDALPLLKREVLDAEVEVRFKRREYKGRARLPEDLGLYTSLIRNRENII